MYTFSYAYIKYMRRVGALIPGQSSYSLVYFTPELVNPAQSRTNFANPALTDTVRWGLLREKYFGCDNWTSEQSCHINFLRFLSLRWRTLPKRQKYRCSHFCVTPRTHVRRCAKAETAPRRKTSSSTLLFIVRLFVSFFCVCLEPYTDKTDIKQKHVHVVSSL